MKLVKIMLIAICMNSYSYALDLTEIKFKEGYEIKGEPHEAIYKLVARINRDKTILKKLNFHHEFVEDGEFGNGEITLSPLSAKFVKGVNAKALLKNMMTILGWHYSYDAKKSTLDVYCWYQGDVDSAPLKVEPSK